MNDKPLLADLPSAGMLGQPLPAQQAHLEQLGSRSADVAIYLISGINVCKACTCLVDGKAITVCATRVKNVQGRHVTTIEGLATGDKLHPVQQAWINHDVAQCGFCQPGQIMAAVDLLSRTKTPTDADIDAIENVCRCGTHGRIRQAIKAAAAAMK